jgi:hypothetical protein
MKGSVKHPIQQPINRPLTHYGNNYKSKKDQAVLTQLKTIFYSIYCFYITENDKRYNIVKKEIATEIIPRENPLYFNAIDIPLLHTKIRKVAKKI